MPEQNVNRPLVVAHRGASYAAPENTIMSFKLAFDEDADFIEGDFWLTRDKEIVCIHDLHTARVSNANFNVRKSTLAELKKIEIYYRGNHLSDTYIPTLNEVLNIIPAGKGIFIEIKDDRDEFVKVLFDKLNASGFQHDKIKIISFDPRILAAVKKHNASIKTYWLFSWFPLKKNCKTKYVLENFLTTVKTIKCDGINFNAACGINKNIVSELRKRDLDFCAYDVDDADVLFNLMEMGVDAVTTNYPKKIREQMIAFIKSSAPAPSP